MLEFTNKPGKNIKSDRGVQRLLCCFNWMVPASSSQLVIAAEMALLSRKAVDETVWGLFHAIFALKGLSVTWTILICKVSVSPKWKKMFSDSWHDTHITPKRWITQNCCISQASLPKVLGKYWNPWSAFHRNSHFRLWKRRSTSSLLFILVKLQFQSGCFGLKQGGNNKHGSWTPSSNTKRD